MAVSFPDPYTYSTANGVQIPTTSTVKESVIAMFKEALGSDISTDETTAIGRQIEAITMMFVNMLGVTAQNANGLNPHMAVGSTLNMLGSLFGVVRGTGESDASYRTKILESQSRGSGYVQSVKNALSRVSGIDSVCVLENGYAYPYALPNNTYGCLVAPHSLFISLGGSGYVDSEVAQAIWESKSAGCGFTDYDEYGTKVTVASPDGVSSPVTFYRSIKKTIKVAVSISVATYVGTSIYDDTYAAIRNLFASKSTNALITEAEVISAIASYGNGLVATSLTIYDSGVAVPESGLAIRPYEYVSPSDISIPITFV